MNQSVPAPTPGPLTPEHLRALADARQRSAKVRRAATVAAVSGWSMALFSGLTFLGVLFGSITSLVMSLALAALAWNELRGGAMLRRLDARGAARLGYNQIALGVLIVVYAAWSLARSMNTSALDAVGGSTGDVSMDAMITEMTRLVNYSVYGTLIAVGVLVPGLTAWYYFSRDAIVRTVLARSPAWVIDAMRASS